MVDALHPPPSMRSSVSSSSFLATILMTLAAIGVLLVADFFLTWLSRTAAAAQATSEYDQGRRALANGDATSAVDHFQAAVADDRQNISYALGLAEARLAQGKPDDAETTLRTLLDRAGNDGAINLEMARVMTREGRLDEAVAYYHRAIYGQWGSDSAQRRQAVRIELIDLLVRRRSPRAIAAELLPLEEAAPDSVPLQLWIAQRYLLAGSPSRAADDFRQVIRRDPRNAQAYAGLGEAALTLGNFQSASANLREAARLAPRDTAIAAQQAVADSTLVLDPTQRGLGAVARAQRSRALLARTLASVLACGVRGATSDSASALLASMTKPSSPAESVGERMTTLATELWGMRPQRCAIGPSDRPLALVQARLAQ